MNTPLVLTSLAVCGAIGVYYAQAWTSGERMPFLPGKTTHGHYQIELACNTCHDAWTGSTQEACEGCHEAELELADDSHPKSKFTDPRNADRVALLDARECVTCHVEHKPELTGTMGLTQPEDYCFMCHSDIGEERESHAGLGFETCNASGCHNFHDNRSLHEDYLEQHLHEPATLPQARLLVAAAPTAETEIPRGLTSADQDAPTEIDASQPVVDEWARSAHAAGGVNCSACHAPEHQGKASPWAASPPLETCRECHDDQAEGFSAGRHGMRLSQGLSPMRPGMARLPMAQDAHDRELSCNSCHGAHDYDRTRAATEACLGCHADEHSLAYERSPHARLAKAEQAGTSQPGTGVTCASCHLPRVSTSVGSAVQVQHNQNLNLRPRDKMIREVCSACHGVPFAIDALADDELVEANFRGRPKLHVESVDMIARKLERIKASRAP